MGNVHPPIVIVPDDITSAPVELTKTQDSSIERIVESRAQLSETVTPNTVPPGATVAYTLRMFNVDQNTVGGVSVVDTLPPGFSFQAGSTSGATTANPNINGQNLTWAGPFSVPADGGSLALTFLATTASSSGTYFSNVSGTSLNGVVVGSGDTAPVTVGFIAPAQVPEADTLILVGTGLAGLAGYASLRWRARRRAQ